MTTPENFASTALIVREARATDLDAIVEFNRLLALETEGKALEDSTLRDGVSKALLEQQNRIRYWLAEYGQAAGPIGQAGITREWSDWRNGWIWWLQSVYVDSEHRGRGVFRALLGEIKRAAHSSPDVIGLRLYVEESNLAAQKTYRALGLSSGGYHVYEQFWTTEPTQPLSTPV